MTDSPVPAKTLIANPHPVSTEDGRTLTTYVLGNPEGTDVVLFESGAGTGAAYWGPTAEAIATASPAVRVVAYDRAGYGKSTYPKDRRTLSDLADDLITVVQSLRARRVVLVGHSLGGPIVRLADAKLSVAAAGSPGPAEGAGVPVVVGIVLVDPTDELCDRFFGKTAWAFWANSWLMIPMAYTGFLAGGLHSRLSGLPAPYLHRAVQDASSTNAGWAGSYEVANIEPGLRALQSHPPALGIGTKLTVISAKAGDEPGTIREALIAAHRKRAEEHNGKFVLDEKSSHNIPVDDPALVAQEALAMLS